jgi:hypothetical protein
MEKYFIEPGEIIISNRIDCCTIENYTIHRIIPVNCKVISLSVFPQITNHSLQLKGNGPFANMCPAHSRCLWSERNKRLGTGLMSSAAWEFTPTSQMTFSSAISYKYVRRSILFDISNKLMDTFLLSIFRRRKVPRTCDLWQHCLALNTNTRTLSARSPFLKRMVLWTVAFRNDT